MISFWYQLFSNVVLLSVLVFTLCNQTICSRHPPSVAFSCNKASKHYSVETERWISDSTQECLKGYHDILKYCRDVYPKLNVIFIVPWLNKVELKDWCPIGLEHCESSHKSDLTVRPFWCLAINTSSYPFFQFTELGSALSSDRLQLEGKARLAAKSVDGYLATERDIHKSAVQNLNNYFTERIDILKNIQKRMKNVSFFQLNMLQQQFCIQYKLFVDKAHQLDMVYEYRLKELYMIEKKQALNNLVAIIDKSSDHICDYHAIHFYVMEYIRTVNVYRQQLLRHYEEIAFAYLSRLELMESSFLNETVFIYNELIFLNEKISKFECTRNMSNFLDMIFHSRLPFNVATKYFMKLFETAVPIDTECASKARRLFRNNGAYDTTLPANDIGSAVEASDISHDKDQVTTETSDNSKTGHVKLFGAETPTINVFGRIVKLLFTNASHSSGASALMNNTISNAESREPSNNKDQITKEHSDNSKAGHMKLFGAETPTNNVFGRIVKLLFTNASHSSDTSVPMNNTIADHETREPSVKEDQPVTQKSFGANVSSFASARPLRVTVSSKKIGSKNVLESFMTSLLKKYAFNEGSHISLPLSKLLSIHGLRKSKSPGRVSILFFKNDRNPSIAEKTDISQPQRDVVIKPKSLTTDNNEEQSIMSDPSKSVSKDFLSTFVLDGIQRISISSIRELWYLHHELITGFLIVGLIFVFIGSVVLSVRFYKSFKVIYRGYALTKLDENCDDRWKGNVKKSLQKSVRNGFGNMAYDYYEKQLPKVADSRVAY